MKEQDPIKDYIDRNREEFDDRKLPEGIWEGIEKELPQEKVERMVPLNGVLRVAAAVILVLGMGIVLTILMNREDPSAIAEDEKQEYPEPNIYERYPELADAEFYYASRIEGLQEELNKFEISEEDFESLALLEEELTELKKELGDEVSNEDLIQAMMEIYKYKLEMLEDMLQQIRGDKNEKYSKDEVQVVTL
jgi:hypothetical protein